jgi:hypothetical protein
MANELDRSVTPSLTGINPAELLIFCKTGKEFIVIIMPYTSFMPNKEPKQIQPK